MARPDISRDLEAYLFQVAATASAGDFDEALCWLALAGAELYDSATPEQQELARLRLLDGLKEWKAKQAPR